MLRLLLYLLLIAPLVYAALWIAERPGLVSMDWNGWRVETSLGVLMTAVLFITFAAGAIVLALRFLLAIPGSFSMRAQLRHQRQGIAALTHAMTALAIADYSQAEREIGKSRRLLGKDAPAPNLLAAQLAHARGDRQAVRRQLAAMLDAPETRLVGLRGMIEQCLREGRIEQAAAHAREAWEAQPHDRWLALMLIDLYTRQEAWAQAREAIAQSTRKKGLSRAEMQRYLAVVALLEARRLQAEKRTGEALERAMLARRSDPHFEPAQQLLIALLAEMGEEDKLVKAIAGAWKDAPRPEYIDALIAQFGHEPPGKFHRRLEKILSGNPQHRESQIARARAALHRRDFAAARERLQAAFAQGGESARLYELQADIERAEHGHTEQVTAWLAQAVAAPKDEQWLCTRCGHAHSVWELHCAHCGAFDSLTWARPDHLPPPEDQSAIALS